MTGLNSNIVEIINKFKTMKNQLQEVDLSEALVFGVNAAKSRMQNRIFDDGHDADNGSLGGYVGKKSVSKKTKSFGFETDKIAKRQLGVRSGGINVNLTPYEWKRVSNKREIVYKDLEFYGTLRRGIVIIKESSNRVVTAIPNNKLYLIARGQEAQIGGIRGGGPARIFSLSKEEEELLRTNVIAAVNQIYARIFNTNQSI